MNKIVYITAGEQSGDLLGSEVIKHLKASIPDVVTKGIGGEMMTGAGLIPVFRTEQLGFMGFFELIKHAFVIRKAFRTVLKSIIADKPSVVLMIDFSEFHIKLAKKIKKMLPETKIIKYVCPQIWASRESRIKDIVEYYDCLCCILPFEPELFRNELIDCRYVGHPLMDKYKTGLGFSEFCEKFGLSEDKTLISVFPGSREQEVKKHLPVLRDYFRKISTRDDIQIAACRSGNIKEETFGDADLPSQVKIISSEYQWDIMEHSGIVLCKSGTSTLQTAITKTPSIVFYKVNPLSFYIAKKIVKTKFISLPNIIAGKQINPELIQSDFTSEALLKETDKLLNNEDIYQMRKNELGLVRDALGGTGAGNKVAQAVIDYI
ncbi:MAG: lipid-A-disaccharide synthase [Candidatus Delongbacteria bacterium]|nr:lipid-A-disaccharide synthase [Candidatus Delongbacteria bacterium]